MYGVTAYYRTNEPYTFQSTTAPLPVLLIPSARKPFPEAAAVTAARVSGVVSLQLEDLLRETHVWWLGSDCRRELVHTSIDPLAK